MSLENKTITELRGYAQAMGIKFDWGWDRPRLLREIKSTIDVTLQRPTVSDEPSDQRLRTVPPARNLSQVEVMKALERFKERGLVVTFPTPDTIYMTHTVVKEDSCSLRVPLRTIIECAKKVLQ